MFRLDSLLFLFFEGESLEQFLGFFGCDAILLGGLLKPFELLFRV